MTRYSPIERIGVAEVEKIFLQMNWIPRTIFQTDVGIDMTVEICKNGNPIGKFIAVQIKTGESYFKEKSGDSIIFRTDKTHIDYWINNSLPVIIVLHNQINNTTIWQVVNRETAQSTGKNFKIEVPLINRLEKTPAETIEKLTETPILLRKFQKLLIDKPIMDLILKGEKITIELQSWINKTSGRADITIYHVIQDKDFDEEIELEQIRLAEFSAIGVHSHTALYYFYPWANFELDETFYETFSDYDEDEMPGYKLVFMDDRFHGYKLGIIPYHNNGETAMYRLEMSLNDYGKSFIDFFNYTSGNKQLEIKFD